VRPFLVRRVHLLISRPNDKNLNQELTMIRFAISMAVVASFAVFGSTTAMAGKGGGRPGPSGHFQGGNHQFHSNSGSSFRMTHGTRFSHGYYFRSRQGYWGQRHWNSTYRCYCYTCPYTNCEYYYCRPYQCYYPVGYCPTGSYNYTEDNDD
jgi:hypothetical protein